MPANAIDIIPLLVWVISVVGATLLALVIWVWMRLQKTVDNLPTVIAGKVKAVHDEILLKVSELTKTQKDLERDIRDKLTDLDRRVTVVETRYDMINGK